MLGDIIRWQWANDNAKADLDGIKHRSSRSLYYSSNTAPLHFTPTRKQSTSYSTFTIMGQYYNLINLDKRQFFSTYSSTTPNADGSYTLNFSNFYSGAKMWEKLMNRGEKPLLAMALAHFSFPASAITEGDEVKNPMTPMGSWSGDRIVIIGDYSEGFPPFFTPQDQQDYKDFYAYRSRQGRQGKGSNS
jgi:hypothetical protein